MSNQDILRELKERMHNQDYHDQHHISDNVRGGWSCECGEYFANEQSAETHAHLDCRLEYTDRDIEIGLDKARKQTASQIFAELDKLLQTEDDLTYEGYTGVFNLISLNDYLRLKYAMYIK